MMVNRRRRTTAARARTRLGIDQRRAQLLELGRTLFNERAYDEISIDDIADAAGISKGLLYHYFSSKRRFFVEVVRAAAARMLELTEPPPADRTPRERLSAGLDAYLAYVGGNARAYAWLLRSGVGVDAQVRGILEDARRAIADRVTDPELAEQIKGFIGQETRHGLEHERFFEIMRAQGYDLETFLRVYETIGFRIIERVAPPKLRLSTTVALEHFTATLARTALSRELLDFAHPTMRDLLRWHAAEEIEHKSVAFDLLRVVDDSYLLRLAGLAVATSTLLPFWIAASWMLMAQDRDVPLRALLADRSRVQKLHLRERRRLARAFVEYLRRDFHPSMHDDAHLARAYFERRQAPTS